MNDKRRFSIDIDEEYFETIHKSGLKIIVFPKMNLNASYAIIGTRYGSINTGFTENGEHVEIPDGTAHFLEHKLFEGKKEDAFARFARTGAYANAYTSFDKTAYLFSGTENIEKSLEILLDFVSHPHFTEENVAKEQGIIGQEIEMYNDDADWQSFFRAIDSAYKTHPIKKDIAGTRETIKTLTPELLNKIYRHFYSSNNMVLCIAGQIDEKTVLKIADKAVKLKPQKDFCPDKPHEEKGVFQKRTSFEMPIAKTLFGIAIKSDVDYISGEDAVKADIAVALALDLIAGGTSKFYNELYEKNVFSDISVEYMLSESYGATVITGFSDTPEKVYEEFFKAANNLIENGIEAEDFEMVRKNRYGKYVAGFDSAEAIANAAMNAEFMKTDLFKTGEILKNITPEEVISAAKWAFNEENAAMVTILPKAKQ